MISTGSQMKDIAEAHPLEFIKYFRGFQELQRVLRAGAPRDPSVPPVVRWLFGPTGTGKSRRAFEEYPQAYVKMNNKWWDGYHGDQVVIMDDYRPGMCSFAQLLQILDRYPMKVELKGSSQELCATTFVITCCARPEVIWHGKTEENVHQLLRRITEIVEFGTDGRTTILKDSLTTYVPLTNTELSIHPYVMRDSVNINGRGNFVNTFNLNN